MTSCGTFFSSFFTPVKIEWNVGCVSRARSRRARGSARFEKKTKSVRSRARDVVGVGRTVALASGRSRARLPLRLLLFDHAERLALLPRGDVVHDVVEALFQGEADDDLRGVFRLRRFRRRRLRRLLRGAPRRSRHPFLHGRDRGRPPDALATRTRAFARRRLPPHALSVRDVVEPRVRFFPARGRRAGAAPSRARPHRAGVDALTDLAPFLVSRAGERGLKQTLCHPNPPTRGWNARRGRLARASLARSRSDSNSELKPENTGKSGRAFLKRLRRRWRGEGASYFSFRAYRSWILSYGGLVREDFIIVLYQYFGPAIS